MGHDLKQKILELWEVEHVSLIVVDPGRWVSDGKYENKETIVQYDGRHYCIDQYRSGSYFTDYDSEPPEVYEVEPEERTVIVWKPKAKL